MSETLSPSALGRDGANPHISTGELNEAATELVLRHGAMIMRDALKYSATSEDADDAYQRALEILLTKAPSTDPGELVPWLRVVVRRRGARHLPRPRPFGERHHRIDRRDDGSRRRFARRSKSCILANSFGC